MFCSSFAIQSVPFKSLIILLYGYLHDVPILHAVTAFTRKTQILLTAVGAFMPFHNYSYYGISTCKMHSCPH